jgi:hypothetical protein
MTREGAIKEIKSWDFLNKKETEAIETLIPELRESEDERIRGAIVELVKRTPSSMFDADIEFDWVGASHDEILTWLEKQKEQKPAEWSEKHIADIFEKVGLAKIAREQGNDELTNAVQSAMIELSKTGTADEQFPPLEGLDAIKAKYYDDGFKNGFDEGVESVKSAEWSGEDEVYLQDALWCVKQAAKVAREENDMGACWSAERWLKSLRPQPHWKPSDEQMEALSDACVEANTFKKGDILESLYNDLKKL